MSDTEKPGLRAVDPNEEQQPQPELPVSADQRARVLLTWAESKWFEGERDQAGVLAMMAQAWATLALIEPSETATDPGLQSQG